jgi:hypothetical protein
MLGSRKIIGLEEEENFYHCCVVDIKTDETFHLRAVSHEGEVVDDYLFQKETPGEDVKGVEDALPITMIITVVIAAIAMIEAALSFMKR